LGTELTRVAPAGWTVLSYDSDELDITRPEVVAEVLERDRPDVVINAAAFTGVDAAESDPATAEAVNATGAGQVADACRRTRARMIQLSTDYVFDGMGTRPYRPGDPTAPLGVYGRTKLAGEAEVVRALGGDALILRTAWLYSGQGHNFALTMLGLLRDRDEVSVVADQFGSPTWCRSLAETVWAAAARPEVRGVHHWTDDGVASWHDLAAAIQEEALALGLLDRAVPIRRLASAEYPRAARRPAYSVLDSTATARTLDLTHRPWRVNLQRMLRELAHG
jgi:dTDP-4-dehydrorhamnose reductase